MIASPALLYVVGGPFSCGVAVVGGLEFVAGWCAVVFEEVGAAVAAGEEQMGAAARQEDQRRRRQLVSSSTGVRGGDWLTGGSGWGRGVGQHYLVFMRRQQQHQRGNRRVGGGGRRAERRGGVKRRTMGRGMDVGLARREWKLRRRIRNKAGGSA